MKAVGFDIGTTTICGIVVDVQTGEAVQVRTLENDTWITGQEYERLQDPEKIWEKVRGLYQEFVQTYEDVAVIGLTGQMHGIVYVDESGRAVSPLYTWQDERGNRMYEPASSPDIWKGERGNTRCGKPGREVQKKREPGEDSSPEKVCAEPGKCVDRYLEGAETAGCAEQVTYAAVLTARTGYPMATGYGLTTHYCNVLAGCVPEAAVKLCTIQDYIGMRLTGRRAPLTASSDAASLGCFDLKKGCFDTGAIRRAGMDPAILPETENGYALLGKTGEQIPVSIAVGDNQASVIGSVREMEGSLLINIGTSSQVSATVRGYRDYAGVELRPVAGEDYIFVGAGLCGGRAYAVLEQFFAQTVEAMTGTKPEGKLYGRMAKLLEEREKWTEKRDRTQESGYCTRDTGSEVPGNRYEASEGENERTDGGRLTVDTRLCGTREHPELTGAIRGITPWNVTPAELTFGVLGGMAEELFSFYEIMRRYGAGEPKQLIGSGNAIRSNPYLRKLFEDRFRMKMRIPAYREEASYGAVLFALVSAGIFPSLDKAQRLISYCEE